jgi:protease I
MAKVAFVLGDGFEDSEFEVPHTTLRENGHEVTVVGVSDTEELTGKGGRVRRTPDASVDAVTAADFDALVIPGGHSPDHLRTDDGIVRFVKAFADAGKPIAAICHGGSLLIEAGAVGGRTLTSWPSIRTDLVNAGAAWMDAEVVLDDNLVSSRRPEDLPAFTKVLLAKLAPAGAVA